MYHSITLLRYYWNSPDWDQNPAINTKGITWIQRYIFELNLMVCSSLLGTFITFIAKNIMCHGVTILNHSDKKIDRSKSHPSMQQYLEGPRDTFEVYLMDVHFSQALLVTILSENHHVPWHQFNKMIVAIGQTSSKNQPSLQNQSERPR